MILALRHPAWAAKQIASLQHVSGGRVVLGADATDARVERFAASLVDGLGIPPADAARLPVTGTPAEAAEQLAAYAAAGATWIVLGTIGDDWRAQWELLAEAAGFVG